MPPEIEEDLFRSIVENPSRYRLSPLDQELVEEVFGSRFSEELMEDNYEALLRIQLSTQALYRALQHRNT